MIAPLFIATKIVEQDGGVNIYFLQRWEEVRVGLSVAPAKGLVRQPLPQNASLLTQVLFTTVQAGLYRVTFTARRSAADGAGSSLEFVYHWTDGGTPLSKSAGVNATDTTADLYSGTQTFPVDANVNITYDMVYVSTTPGAMKFKYSATAELLQAA